MTLGTKLAASISVVFALLLGTAAVFLTLDEVDFIEEQMDFHGRLLGHVVASAAAPSLAEEEREARIRALTDREERIAVRWLDMSSVESVRSAALPEHLWDDLRDGEVVGRISPADDDTLYTYVPLESPAGSLRVVEIAESLEARDSHVRSLLLRVIGGTSLGLLLSGALAYVLGRRIVGRPVAELVEVARTIGRGDFSTRADETRRDELGTLAREMNEMAANLERARDFAAQQEAVRRRMEAQLLHADRLATLGQLASGVAHEIGTPLQSITVRAEMLAEKAGHVEGVRDSVRGIQRESSRVATIVRNLLRFGRKQSPQRASHDLREIAERALTLVKTARSKSKAAVELVPVLDGEAARVTVDDEQIEQVLTNLILNGVQAMPAGGRVTVGVGRATALPPPDIEDPAERYICVYVEDEGHGISDDVRPHLFDPFFTTKGVGEGTGLGLSISYGIVREHGGWIDVQSVTGQGSRFSVYLPAEISPSA